MNTFTIGRSNQCSIQLNDPSKEIGNHHTTIEIDDDHHAWIERRVIMRKVGDKEQQIVYPVRVNGFSIVRKRLRAQDKISLGKEHNFELHHHFKMKGDRVVALREDHDFTDEMLLLKPVWKTEAELNRELRIQTILKTVVLVGVFSGAAYWIMNWLNTSGIMTWGATGVVGLVTVGVRTFISDETNQKRKENALLVKATNKCPRCGKFMEGDWEQIKKVGNHIGNCKARWKL